MWEYKREQLSLSTYGEIEMILNKNGLDNWEVIFYNEKKPDKYGENIELIIIYKRLINKRLINKQVL